MPSVNNVPRNRKENSSPCVYVLHIIINLPWRKFTSKSLSLLPAFLTFSLPSPSSLLKLPEFCYIQTTNIERAMTLNKAIMEVKLVY